MGLLQKFFDKHNAPKPEKTDPWLEYTAAVAESLGCKCHYFPPDNDIWPVQAAYLIALRNRDITPVLLVLNEDYKMLPEYSAEQRDELLNKPLIDGKKWLDESFAELQADIELHEGGDYWQEELIGQMSGGQKLQMLITGWQENLVRSQPMLLLEIPTDKPWEVFAWLQFGGWNECPLPEVHMAVSKYWYEKFRARPMVISADTIEYHLDAPIPIADAMDTAKEQCAFCSDIVLQGTGSIGRLADCLHRSSSWYFWWD